MDVTCHWLGDGKSHLICSEAHVILPLQGLWPDGGHTGGTRVEDRWEFWDITRESMENQRPPWAVQQQDNAKVQMGWESLERSQGHSWPHRAYMTQPEEHSLGHRDSQGRDRCQQQPQPSLQRGPSSLPVRPWAQQQWCSPHGLTQAPWRAARHRAP